MQALYPLEARSAGIRLFIQPGCLAMALLGDGAVVAAIEQVSWRPTGIAAATTWSPMKKQAFPWIALSLGLMVMVTLLGAGALRPAEEYGMPLLTMLIVTEFGFFLTAIGAFIGINILSKEGIRLSLLITAVACILLAIGFLALGLRMWPGGFPAL